MPDVGRRLVTRAVVGLARTALQAQRRQRRAQLWAVGGEPSLSRQRRRQRPSTH
jgi:hypothetical protein